VFDCGVEKACSLVGENTALAGKTAFCGKKKKLSRPGVGGVACSEVVEGIKTLAGGKVVAGSRGRKKEGEDAV